VLQRSRRELRQLHAAQTIQTGHHMVGKERIIVAVNVALSVGATNGQQ